jgi:hypothetical protein
LETLSETTQTFLVSECLEKLSLPKLRDIKRYIAGAEKQKRHYGHYVAYRKMKTRISQATLDKLAENCPNLLRLSGTNIHPTLPSPFIFAQRLNGATKLRKVRATRKWTNGHRLQFDYDSVEDCSSDEELVHVWYEFRH